MIQSPLTALALILLTSGFAVQHSADSTARAAAGPMADAPTPAQERLGTVSFAVTCAAAQQAAFSRGVALLHDFWYDEARPQFERVAAADPSCAMAHWGIAMSVFHQIWDRPDEAAMALGWREITAAQAHPARSARERGYIAALEGFYRPDGRRGYPMRIRAYADAMAGLYRHHPQDIDAGAFYALSLLAAEAPDDTSLIPERTALSVLEPLFARHPDHPGVVHYIIHACDTPALAGQGLAAARLYGRIAPSGPHAVHMPGHIFARLGMWQPDIDANLASVAASHAAAARHLSGVMDQFHADDFLLYAYLQSGQELRARAIMEDAAAALGQLQGMSNMADNYMTGMFPYYHTKFPVFYALEMRDWNSAAALEPVADATPDAQTLTYWARAVADGHMHRAERARADLAAYDALMERVKKGRHAYYADSTGARIKRGEMLAWIAFAQGDAAASAKAMRDCADLQDKVGQGEVDIPAREMLADILLEAGQPQAALAEYAADLKLSPKRFNGLFNAGRAAEAAGDTADAKRYYSLLLEVTGDGAHSGRPEFEQAKRFLAANLAANPAAN